jgi:hypothetical protein
MTNRLEIVEMLALAGADHRVTDAVSKAIKEHASYVTREISY